MMQEYLCNDVTFILAPILLLLTMVNAAMILTDYKAENVSGEDDGDEGPEKLICAVLQFLHARHAERLIAKQQEDIQRLSARVAELCEWLDQLTPMVHSNEHVTGRLLSMSIQKRRSIEVLKHRLGWVEEVLGALTERERQQEEERKEKAKRERAEKRKAGIWEVSGRRLRRVGREDELRAGRYQEGVEQAFQPGGERGFEMVGGNGEDIGNFAAQGMQEPQVLQRNEVYPAQLESPLPFFNGVYDPDRAKMEHGRNRGVFEHHGGSREEEIVGRNVSREPFVWAAHGGRCRHAAAR